MNLNKENMLRIMQLIVFTVVILVAAVNYKNLFQMAGRILGLLFPFILGAAIAFVLNVPMRFLERHLDFGKHGRLKRPVCLTASILTVFAVLGIVLLLVVPELTRTVGILKNSVPFFFEHVKDQANSMFSQYPELVEAINSVSVDWGRLAEDMAGFIHSGAGTLLSSTVDAAGAILNGLTSLVIGFVFAVYILLQKEELRRQMGKLLHAFLPEKAAGNVLRVAALTERTFSKFLTGQCTEAVILGTMFFLVLTVCRLPYALLIGVLIAFTALIPVFGAFIGWFIGAFLMLMVSPLQTLIFTVIFLVLQQLEGNLIYPHVVGNSVGLPSIWVLAAVTLGGSTMGVVGMLIFIPLCSVAYTLLREKVNANLEKKGRQKGEV